MHHTTSNALFSFGDWAVDVDKSVDRSVTSRYKRGQKSIPNEDYYRLVDQEAEAIANYNRLINNPPAVDNSPAGSFAAGAYRGMVDNAIGSVKEIQAKIARTPQTLVVDDNVQYQFNEKHYRLSGDVEMRATVTAGPATITSTVFRAHVDEKYVYRDGVHPEDRSYSPSKSLAIPDESTVLLWMALQLASDVESWFDQLHLVKITGQTKTVHDAVYDEIERGSPYSQEFYQIAFSSVSARNPEGLKESDRLRTESKPRSFSGVKQAVKYAKSATFQVTAVPTFDPRNPVTYFLKR